MWGEPTEPAESIISFEAVKRNKEPIWDPRRSLTECWEIKGGYLPRKRNSTPLNAGTPRSVPVWMRRETWAPTRTWRLGLLRKLGAKYDVAELLRFGPLVVVWTHPLE